MKNKILDAYFEKKIANLKRNCIISAVVLIAIVLFATSCKKEDFSLKPSPFKIGDHVRIKFDATKSFVPHCGDPSMNFTVTNNYLIADQIYWWYDIKSDDGCVLIHVDNGQLKRY